MNTTDQREHCKIFLKTFETCEHRRSTRAQCRGSPWPMASPVPAGETSFSLKNLLEKISKFMFCHCCLIYHQRDPVSWLTCKCFRLPLNNYEETEFNNGNGENREERRKKEVEDLISKYAKKKENEEVVYLSDTWWRWWCWPYCIQVRQEEGEWRGNLSLWHLMILTISYPSAPRRSRMKRWLWLCDE